MAVNMTSVDDVYLLGLRVEKKNKVRLKFSMIARALQQCNSYIAASMTKQVQSIGTSMMAVGNNAKT